MTKTTPPLGKRGRGRGRSPDGKPNPVDVHVGSRIRLRRTLLGMSQTKLGEEIGLTFQQVQKYEKGSNRVSSSRMFELSRVLDVPISYFFDEMSGDTKQRGHLYAMGKTSPASKLEDLDPMTKRETLELVRAYYKITDPKVRKRMFEMVKAIAAAAVQAAEKNKPPQKRV